LLQVLEGAVAAAQAWLEMLALAETEGFTAAAAAEVVLD
jgi:hypothetical protein